MKTAIPSPRQLKFQEWELGLFVHYLVGIYRQKKEGYRAEKDKVSPDVFRPTQLDCDQWIRVAKSAGMKYAILTAKHHDGFCLWPSSVTPDFSVAASPWNGGKGDVIREFTDACHRHGVAAGIYYSPFDAHCPFYKDEKRYDEYMLTHLRELLGNYGKIEVIWFDGYLSEGHTYDWPRMVAEMRRLQPDILMFNMGDPDYRWVGNESGIAPIPCWNTVEEVDFSMASDQKEQVGAARWLPAECDARMRYEGWSWRGPHDPIKGLEELMGLYYYSVGRGCNLLLNVGPDQRGVVNEDDAARMAEFGEEIARRFGRPLCSLADCVKTADNRWEWAPQQVALVDHAVIMEDITAGEHVRKFRICAHTAPEAKFPVTLYEGYNIGHKAICRFPQIKIKSIYLEVVEADGPVTVRSLEFHDSAGSV